MSSQPPKGEHGERILLLEYQMTTIKETCEKMEQNSTITNDKLDKLGNKVYIGLGILIATQFIIEILIPLFHK